MIQRLNIEHSLYPHSAAKVKMIFSEFMEILKVTFQIKILISLHPKTHSQNRAGKLVFENVMIFFRK